MASCISACFGRLRWRANRLFDGGSYASRALHRRADERQTAVWTYQGLYRPQRQGKPIHIAFIPYKESSIIYSIISKQLKCAGILSDGKRRGPHALRHSLASGLLNEETPPPIIASALGHVNTKNTNRYLRIDMDQLRKVALEVPV